MITAESIIIIAFSATNACRLLAYLPQIAVILRQGDLSGISTATWLLFSVSNGVTAIYAAFVAADATMTLVFVANTFCCAVIVALVCWKRRRSCGLSAAEVRWRP